METEIYGPHQMFDIYGCDPRALFNKKLILEFLESFPDIIGMKTLHPPLVVSVTEEDIAGVTGVILIVTSHISIHTYALKGCAWIDIFSCKPFDVEAARRYIQETFNPERIEVHHRSRGIDFPVYNIHEASILREDID